MLLFNKSFKLSVKCFKILLKLGLNKVLTFKLHTTETDAMVAAGVEFYGNDALLAILNLFPFPPSFNIDVIISR